MNWMHNGKGLAKRWLALLAIATAALGAVLAVPQQAQAATWENCEPYLPLPTYQADLCAYPASAPYLQGSGDNVYINVYVDKNTISTNQTNINDAISAAILNWNYSGAHVRLSLTGNPNAGNLLTIHGSTTGADFTTSCGHAWGQSWYHSSTYDNGLAHQVLLNSLIFNTCGSTDTWTGVVVHEMGHTMGLGHNNYYNGAVNMRMNTNAVKLRDGTPMTKPQFTDYFIFNKIYTAYPTMCYSLPSNQWCNGMDPNEQSCPAFSQEIAYNPYGWVQLYYSGSHCQSNWTKGAATASGWRIYRIQTVRYSGLDGDQITIEDIPNTTSWYTNLVYSPNNQAQSFISYINTSTGSVTGWYYTGRH